MNETPKGSQEVKSKLEKKRSQPAHRWTGGCDVQFNPFHSIVQYNQTEPNRIQSNPKQSKAIQSQSREVPRGTFPPRHVGDRPDVLFVHEGYLLRDGRGLIFEGPRRVGNTHTTRQGGKNRRIVSINMAYKFFVLSQERYILNKYTAGYSVFA